MKKSPPLTIKLFNNVAKFRDEHNFPPTALAHRVGINRSTLFRIEQGQVIPSVLIALRLAKYLDTPVGKLFTLEETKVLTEEEEFDEYLKDIVKKAREKQK